MVAHGVADNALGVSVHHCCQIKPAFCCLHEGDIRIPDLISTGDLGLGDEQVGGCPQRLGRFAPLILALGQGVNARLTHKSFNPFQGANDPALSQFGVDPRTAIAFAACFKDVGDLL